MSTLKVQMDDELLLQVVQLAAHDGVSPSEFVEAAVAEKVEEIEVSAHPEPPAQPPAVPASAPSTGTIIFLPESSVVVHDHLRPYNA